MTGRSRNCTSRVPRHLFILSCVGFMFAATFRSIGKNSRTTASRQGVVFVVEATRPITTFISAAPDKSNKGTTDPLKQQHWVLTQQKSSTTRRYMATTTTNGSTTATETTSKKISYPTKMTDDEKYLFDLNGYLILRGVLTPEEVEEANRAIDKHSGEFIERSAPDLRNTVKNTSFYGTGPGRKDLGRVLEWGLEDSRVFKSILAHPRLVPIFHELLGKGYRMDHLPFVLAQDLGGEGFQLHGGTIDCTSGQYNPHLAYAYNHGTIRTALLGCNVILTDHNPGDGGFCIVPGSHKSNYRMPKGMVDGEAYSEYIIQPPTKAGDVILFSEGTVHGAKAWTNPTVQRRTCLYRFAPATNAYGRSYFGHEIPVSSTNGEGSNGDVVSGWPSKMYEGLNDAQRSVLEAPYANRLDRPNIIVDPETGATTEVEITSRNARKKQHDRDVFGTKYF